MSLLGFAERRRAFYLARRDAPSASAARVVDELDRCDRKFGKATPPVVGIAARARCSPRTVIRATGWLEAAGYLTVTRRRPHCRGDGTWHRSQTNLYSIRFAHRPWSHRGDIHGTSIASGAIRARAGRPVAGRGTFIGAVPLGQDPDNARERPPRPRGPGPVPDAGPGRITPAELEPSPPTLEAARRLWTEARDAERASRQ